MPHPTLRRLLATRELGLGLLGPSDAVSSAALDTPVSWAHGSDLADPSPFLVPGQLLLTTGTQFSAKATDSDYDGYVARVAGAGIAGLGFGVGVVRETPPGLLDACTRAGLPLLEVPYRTPFIAIARAVADLIAEQAYARNTWALAALRAVSLAALRPDGLSATLAELARQLDRWVALVDASGSLEIAHPSRALSADARVSVESEARRMLSAGRRAASTVAEAGTVVSLQTIGASGRLLGVLAHGGTGDVDQAAQQVVTSVVALAGPALERGHELDSARDAMRSALLRSLDTSAALLVELGDGRPGTRSKARPDGRRAAPSDSAADDDDEGTRAAAAIERVRRRVAADVSSSAVGTFPVAPSAVAASAESSATGAAESGEPGAGGARTTKDGTHAVAREDTGGAAQASALLAPLRAHDRNGALAESLRIWLEHNGIFDAAAREMGVHRHTLTARIRTAEQLLDCDFDSFADRVRMWEALRRTT
jgi:purine catabolism regulator